MGEGGVCFSCLACYLRWHDQPTRKIHIQCCMWLLGRFLQSCLRLRVFPCLNHQPPFATSSCTGTTLKETRRVGRSLLVEYCVDEVWAGNGTDGNQRGTCSANWESPWRHPGAGRRVAWRAGREQAGHFRTVHVNKKRAQQCW